MADRDVTLTEDWAPLLLEMVQGMAGNREMVRYHAGGVHPGRGVVAYPRVQQALAAGYRHP